MDDLLLTDQNRQQLTMLATDPPHALLLVAPVGFGKRFVAGAWARNIAPLVEIVEPDDKGTISIDAIRALYQRTRSRREGRQVVIIDQAGSMGIEAQNAFLKLLEEPRAGVTFVLTAHSNQALLPTIASRVQTLQLQSLPAATLQSWAQKQRDISPQDLAQLLFMAKGRVGVLATLLRDDAAFEKHRQIMQHAKQLLSATPYERLVSVPELIKAKESIAPTLEAMCHMVALQLAKGNTALIPMADALQQCLSALAQNGNPRAQLTRLFTSY